MQASSTLTAVQERVAALAATVGALDTAPPALHRALDALQDTLTQWNADPPSDRASLVPRSSMFEDSNSALHQVCSAHDAGAVRRYVG